MLILRDNICSDSVSCVANTVKVLTSLIEWVNSFEAEAEARRELLPSVPVAHLLSVCQYVRGRRPRLMRAECARRAVHDARFLRSRRPRPWTCSRISPSSRPGSRRNCTRTPLPST